MEITSFALFGWFMALASILFFIFIYKKVRRTTATGAGLRNNDGSADPDVKIVGQDEKYKRATWGICIGASIIVGPMLGFALGLALKLVIPTYYHIEDPTPNGWRKRSIPTHSEWLYPLTFDAGNGLKEA